MNAIFSAQHAGVAIDALVGPPAAAPRIAERAGCRAPGRGGGTRGRAARGGGTGPGGRAGTRRRASDPLAPRLLPCLSHPTLLDRSKQRLFVSVGTV
jgi:hypothetical protein